MNRTLRTLLESAVLTVDGARIPIRDVVIDDRAWQVRCLALDPHDGFSPERLLTWNALDLPRSDERTLFTRETLATIERGPTIQDAPPVRRVLDDRCAEHYGWRYQFGGWVLLRPGSVEPELTQDLERPVDEGGNLRSGHELLGYDLATRDGSLGHLEDIVIAPEDGAAAGVVIDTRNYLPGGRKVLLPIDDIDGVALVPGRVSTGRSTEEVLAAPDFVPGVAVEEVLR